MKKILILSFLSLLLCSVASAHYKARYHVIIDTDGGVDDFRAICMLLASADIEVIAITCVDGVLSPDTTWSRVTALLHRFGHEGIPVGKGTTVLNNAPEFRQFAGRLDWGGKGSLSSQARLNAIDLIRQAVELEEKPVDFLALGPLTNLYDALQQYPELDTSFRKVIWYNKNHEKQGTNYELDSVAARNILNSKLIIDIVGGGNIRLENLERFTAGLEDLASVYADAVRDLYIHNRIDDHYLGTTLADDLVPLYLGFPEAFTREALASNPRINKVSPLPLTCFQDSILILLNSNKEDKSIIFSSFPVDPDQFEPDVRALSGSIISRYGLKEWKIGVLTNEFHEHLGIYSVIGAKMGLRAREFFDVGIDELVITSRAGNEPPLSCLNDGLQVSTGATLGHGTISVVCNDPFPGATFAFKNTLVELSLNEPCRQQVIRDVRKGVQDYGLNTEAYWQYIRQLALRYWLELDRREIFDIKIIPGYQK